MPKVEFLASSAGSAKSVDVPDGGPLVDVCDEALAPVPFSCRSATCATCHIEVLEGLELLIPPEEEERELLDVINAPNNSRLACQVLLKAGPGTVRLRPING